MEGVPNFVIFVIFVSPNFVIYVIFMIFMIFVNYVDSAFSICTTLKWTVKTTRTQKRC